MVDETVPSTGFFKDRKYYVKVNIFCFLVSKKEK